MQNRTDRHKNSTPCTKVMRGNYYMYEKVVSGIAAQQQQQEPSARNTMERTKCRKYIFSDILSGLKWMNCEFFQRNREIMQCISLPSRPVAITLCFCILLLCICRLFMRWLQEEIVYRIFILLEFYAFFLYFFCYYFSVTSGNKGRGSSCIKFYQSTLVSTKINHREWMEYEYEIKQSFHEPSMKTTVPCFEFPSFSQFKF